MSNKTLLYSGKAKSLYTLADDAEHVVVEFRDDATAFDGEKRAQLARKGAVNNQMNAFFMQYLEENGVPTHFAKTLSDNESLMKRLDMIPLECVVRNVATGSMVKRLGVEDGLTLEPPVFEFFLKDDARHDPMVNESHIKTFGWASEQEVEIMKMLTWKVNSLLKPLFANAGIMLVDYKLEFGRFGDQLLLGDEFTPDGCRLWDSETKEKLDKDRFRKDMGGVIEHYEEVASRLGLVLS